MLMEHNKKTYLGSEIVRPDEKAFQEFSEDIFKKIQGMIKTTGRKVCERVIPIKYTESIGVQTSSEDIDVCLQDEINEQKEQIVTYMLANIAASVKIEEFAKFKNSIMSTNMSLIKKCDEQEKVYKEMSKENIRLQHKLTDTAANLETSNMLRLIQLDEIKEIRNELNEKIKQMKRSVTTVEKRKDSKDSFEEKLSQAVERPRGKTMMPGQNRT